jgi:hypothetical protein
MSDLYAALLSWAVTLSGYPAPSEPPIVHFVPHQFFVENACNGRECRVWGWYASGRDLYVDDRADPNDNLLASSIVVHEMVHYLQAVHHALEVGQPLETSGHAYTHGTNVLCHDVIQLEREAYGVQREFLRQYGVYQPVGISMLKVGCDAH